jgi:hypothetical protein
VFNIVFVVRMLFHKQEGRGQFFPHGSYVIEMKCRSNFNWLFEHIKRNKVPCREVDLLYVGDAEYYSDVEGLKNGRALHPSASVWLMI